jgi:hypothetical protein
MQHGRNTLRARDPRIVACNDYRSPLSGKVRKDLGDGSSALVVEMRGRLVEEEQRRITNESASQCDALTLAPGKRASRAAREMTHRKSSQERVGSMDVMRAYSVGKAREKDVFSHRHRVDKLVVLEHEADLVATDLGALGVAQPRGRLAVDKDLATRGGKHCAEKSEEGGLATATWTAQDDELTSCHDE